MLFAVAKAPFDARPETWMSQTSRGANKQRRLLHWEEAEGLSGPEYRIAGDIAWNSEFGCLAAKWRRHRQATRATEKADVSPAHPPPKRASRARMDGARVSKAKVRDTLESATQLRGGDHRGSKHQASKHRAG